MLIFIEEVRFRKNLTLKISHIRMRLTSQSEDSHESLTNALLHEKLKNPFNF